MPTVEISRDEVIDAFCQMVEPIVRKGVLPAEDCNKYGVDVLTNKKDPSLLMFHFVTTDRLEVNYEIDMMRLGREGKAYIDHWMGLLLDQLEQARKFRKAEEKPIEIYTGKLKPSVIAHNEVLH